MQNQWPFYRLWLFRFFFIYLALTIAPWTWLDRIPWIRNITWKIYHEPMDWLVRKSNALVFHVKDELVPVGGSGDTSWGWAQLWMVLSLSFIGMIIWSVIDRRRKQYVKLNYWLCLFTRYYVALVSFSYGIIKLLALQMPFPNYSQLATPLGDFLPMRLSWMFIGYSTPYQVFSGLMEVMAGLLLLYRRTATLGALVATAVFINVAVLNLSYDIPVKIFSIQMVVACLFLLANEMNRILCFFVLNRPADACSIYHFSYPKKWMKITRVVLKLAFIYGAVWLVASQSIDWKKQSAQAQANMVFPAGMYDVVHYVVNQDTVLPLLTDTLRWQNIIFDNSRSGSIATRDTAFRRLYNRAYFRYNVDTVKHLFNIMKPGMDTVFIASMKYDLAGDNTILLRGLRGNDSLSLLLRKSPHNFQLAERQFHWLSEANR
ncbi:MAG TPA: hypothetical protein VD996_10280 [Chitinophagaceae bacterium]|nr:hypothetical protein [Chitinophagaceae bacterium]